MIVVLMMLVLSLVDDGDGAFFYLCDESIYTASL